MAEAITYQSGLRKSDLRTVLVTEVNQSVVLLPAGSLRVLTAKLLEGTTSRHDFWAEILGTDPADHTFICPADRVVAQREITVAAIVKSRKAK
jgi:hypothetical protein